ncbi:recombinase family protein [Leptolyngbya sp. FACHB-321]|uniref:recombinase family protein n=1 Tax=Leptolyngbya sp. FACHB-321 TaxID=2692807 RepID=UPI001682235C|nr:recombinase family protein [Leptolyngbya sp. FACHB-321]
MNSEPIWVSGATRSGKTAYLVNQFRSWIQSGLTQHGTPRERSTKVLNETPERASPPLPPTSLHSSVPPLVSFSTTPEGVPGVLVLAAIGDNRIELVDRLTAATQGKVSLHSTTPLGFFQSEVTLFWSLLIQQLDLKAQFPVRLAPENEQALATQLWRSELDQAIGQQTSLTEVRLVRRLLDLLQLAALAGIPIADIPVILEQGLAGQNEALPFPESEVGELLQRWQNWCLSQGLLTYGIIAGLYWQYLLPNPTYQRYLAQRYQVVLADDVDEYPAIARSVFETLLDAGAAAIFTYNPDGAVRLGLGADPAYLAGLVDRCRIETLTDRPIYCLGDDLGDAVVALATDPIFFASLPDTIQAIQTTSRAQLLRRTAEVIIEAVQTQQVQPRDIVVIAPGVDAIARYSLTEMLGKHQIPVESLNDQRPLTSSPIIRALLTLLTLVYPSLGRLVDREAVAEMLVVLSQQPANGQQSEAPHPSLLTPHPSLIDPVRAGLLADYCFAPHPDRPRLLPVTTFPRWDRLGYQASNAYQAIVQWIATQQSQLEQRLIPNAVSLLDRAIQHFLFGGGALPFEQLSALRQLIETAQHYWEVDGRLRRSQRFDAPAYMTVSRFVQLLQSDTVTANPYPVRPIGPDSNAVLLANVFQYRSSRRVHRWQFWLDAGSPRWLSGVDSLFGAPLFLQGWSGRAWTSADAMDANERRLRRILLDLLGRTEERVYLCHSDLATNGQEQTGVLLSLVNAAVPLDTGLLIG